MKEFRREDTAKLIGLVREPVQAGERTQISLIGRAECLRHFSNWITENLQSTEHITAYILHTPSTLYDHDHSLKYLQVELDENAKELVIKAQGVTVLMRGKPAMFGYLARCCASIADMLDNTCRDGVPGMVSPFKYVVAEGDSFRRYTPGADVLIIQGVWDEVPVHA